MSPGTIPAVAMPKDSKGKQEFVNDVASTWSMSLKAGLVTILLAVLVVAGYLLVANEYVYIGVVLWLLVPVVLIVPWKSVMSRRRST